MTIVPSLPYDRLIRALQRAGWVTVRQKGSHIRLQKHTPDETLKLTIHNGVRLRRCQVGLDRLTCQLLSLTPDLPDLNASRLNIR